MNRRAVIAAFAALLTAAAVASAGDGGSASGEARVDERALALAHAYLFHAPDNWHEEQVNSVVLLTAGALDEEALRTAKTLADALELAGEHVRVEVAPGGEKVDLAICHEGFGAGMCYSTTAYPPEWTATEAPEGHVAGSVRTFTGGEETVFGKYRLFYQFEFDAAPVRDFERRQ